MTLATTSPDDLILWDVVEEHVDESAFLFEQWERALQSPAYTLKQCRATFEDRLEAHLDALVVGGPEVSTRILYPELENEEEPARATVAALAVLSGPDDSAASRVLAAVLSGEGKPRKSLIRALALSRAPQLDALLLQRFGESRSDAQSAVLLEILTGRGLDPGDRLRLCLDSKDVPLVNATLQAVHRFGRRDLVGWAESHIAAADPEVRTRAILASLALGSRRGWQVCQEVVNTGETSNTPLLALTAVLSESSNPDALCRQHGATTMLWILGFCGTVQAGDACVSYLDSEDPRVAKAAAESLAWIAGIDLQERRFRAASTEPELETLPPLEEDNLDAELEGDGLDAVPVPNRAAIAQWWEENRPRFQQHQRWLLGQPFSAAAIIHALKAGPLWRRHLLALELSVRTNGQRHVTTDSFSSQQLREIASLEGMSLPERG